MSAHVTPEYLAYLTRIHDESLSVGWLTDFYDSYWGVQNGAEVAATDTDGRRRTVCIPNRFDLPQTEPIIVRDTYLEVWHHLRAVYLKHNMTRRFLAQATILRGRDRRLAIYFLLVAAAEARVPLVFHCTRDRWACVCVDVGRFFIPHTRVSALSFAARALVIIDAADDVPPTGGVWRAHAHVVVSAPHVAAPDVALAYHAFAKQRCADYYALTESEPFDIPEPVDDVNVPRNGKTVSVIATVHPASCPCTTCLSPAGDLSIHNIPTAETGVDTNHPNNP